MHAEILSNIENPLQLEKLYRHNKPNFKSAFNALYPQFGHNALAEAWYQRLNYSQEEMNWGTPAERLFVVGASLLAGLLAQLPKLLSMDQELFYTRNVGFIVFPILIAWFVWKNRIATKTAAVISVVTVIFAIFINALPKSNTSDTLVLSCIHLPLVLWSILGFVFGGGKLRGGVNWPGFLRYNGDLAVMMALLLIACGLTTGLTIGLFELIGWHIQKFYFDYVVVCGLAAVPVVATFLTQTQPTLVSKISPVIANLFSPVALVMLLVYLAATVFSDKNPYQDREFLIIFNVLLAGVMALIFFSVSDSSGRKNSTQTLILFLLSGVTILVNAIALSAVLFRISEWGLTPNRAAVLGANALMLMHLLLVALRLFSVLTQKSDLSLVGKSMALFLPIYALWAAIVAFLFPLIFGFI